PGHIGTNRLGLLGPITTLRNIFSAPIYRPSAHFPPFVHSGFGVLVCYCWIDKEAFAPRASGWKIAGAGNHRQFRCCCPLETPETGRQCSRNRFQAESREAEIPRITFTSRERYS